jgi:hypothetical protein
MGHPERYEWSEPASVEAIGEPAPTGSGWTDLISMEGHWSHADLWFDGPAGYLGSAFRIIGRVAGIWAQLWAGIIGAPPFPLLAPGANERTGLLATIRGMPCDALLVQARNPGPGVALGTARWRLHAWGREAAAQSTAAGGAVPAIWTAAHDPAAPSPVYVASAAPCIINCAFARNDSGGLRWFQIHDLAAAPLAGAVPVLPALPIPDGQPGSISCDALQLAAGCVLASSLTAATYTADAGAGMDMGALIQ